MKRFLSLFNVKCPVIGMIHVQALPGTPKNSLSPKEIIEKALNEAAILQESGVDSIMIENMHDVPYLKNQTGPEINSVMAIIGHEIKQLTKKPCGIQILSSDNLSAIATAHAAGLEFIRAEGFVYGHLADEGYIDANAGPLMRYRSNLGAQDVCVLTDVKKKHSSHAITKDISLRETAKACEFFLSDGIVVTGRHTAMPASPQDIAEVSEGVNIPVIAGSGVTVNNVHKFLPICDALIVGSHFKLKGHWANDPDPARIFDFMQKVISLRKKKPRR